LRKEEDRPFSPIGRGEEERGSPKGKFLKGEGRVSSRKKGFYIRGEEGEKIGGEGRYQTRGDKRWIERTGSFRDEEELKSRRFFP
jgi:hypothetical protein